MLAASPPLEWPNSGMFVGVNDAEAGVSLGKLVCSVLARKSVVSSDLKTHESPSFNESVQVFADPEHQHCQFSSRG